MTKGEITYSEQFLPCLIAFKVRLVQRRQKVSICGKGLNQMTEDKPYLSLITAIVTPGGLWIFIEGRIQHTPQQPLEQVFGRTIRMLSTLSVSVNLRVKLRAAPIICRA